MQRKEFDMPRVFTDFNARTPDGLCWLLKFNNSEIEQQIKQLGLRKGDKMLLYQDEDDFNVTATIDFRYVDALGRETWVAAPDWSTLVRS
jgi:hypothetical protein